MASTTLGNTQNTQVEASTAQLEPIFSAAMANLVTESTAVQLELPTSAAVAIPEAEAGTAVTEGAIAVEKMKMPSVESISQSK